MIIQSKQMFNSNDDALLNALLKQVSFVESHRSRELSSSSTIKWWCFSSDHNFVGKIVPNKKKEKNHRTIRSASSFSQRFIFVDLKSKNIIELFDFFLSVSLSLHSKWIHSIRNEKDSIQILLARASDPQNTQTLIVIIKRWWWWIGPKKMPRGYVEL